MKDDEVRKLLSRKIHELYSSPQHHPFMREQISNLSALIVFDSHLLSSKEQRAKIHPAALAFTPHILDF
jgi:hypothetical protein